MIFSVKFGKRKQECSKASRVLDLPALSGTNPNLVDLASRHLLNVGMFSSGNHVFLEGILTPPRVLPLEVPATQKYWVNGPSTGWHVASYKDIQYQTCTSPLLLEVAFDKKTHHKIIPASNSVVGLGHIVAFTLSHHVGSPDPPLAAPSIVRLQRAQGHLVHHTQHLGASEHVLGWSVLGEY